MIRRRMSRFPALPEPWLTLLTIALGALGAALAYALSLPAAILMGPALVVSLACLAGLRLGVSDIVRDICFVALGLSIGSGFDTDASAAILRWPLAFVVLGVALLITMQACQMALIRGFGFDRRSAVLAAAPGHLSFVMGIATSMEIDAGRIAVVQTIRLLALTLIVPFAALAMGFQMEAIALPGGPPGQMGHLAILTVLAVAVGLVFRRIGLPAPLILGAMVVSALGHVTDLTPGGLPVGIVAPAFLVLGTLIGTRFAGMRLTEFRSSLMAGLTTTLIAVTTASAAALPVAYALGIPVAHVLTAFAPGGLETMIALGVTMGASPGFVAACHMMRLLILSVMIPVLLTRQQRQRR